MSKLTYGITTDPRIDTTNNLKEYFTYRSSPNTTNYIYQSSNFSNSNIGFSINLPSNTSFIERNSAIMTIKVRLTMSGLGSGTGTIYNPLYEAFRCKPINKCLTSLLYSINSVGFSYQENEIDKIFDKFENKEDETDLKDYDKTQIYSMSTGGIISPFAQYTDRVDSRATHKIDVLSNTTTGAVIESDVMLNLSNGIFNTSNNTLGVSLDNFTITCVMSDLRRMWSRDTINHPQNLSSLAVDIVSASIKLTLLDSVMQIPKALYYDYKRYDVFKTQTPVINQNLLQLNTVQSQILSLPTVPSMIYVAVAPSGGFVNSSLSNLIGVTDTFCEIVSNSFIFANKSSLLSSESQKAIYQRSKNNNANYKVTFPEWRSQQGSDSALLLSGSVDIINPSRDLSVAGEFESVNSKINFQATVDFRALNPTPNISYEMIVICEYDGLLTNFDSSSSEITTTPIQNINQVTIEKPYNDLRIEAAGSSFFSKLRSVISPVNKFLKDTKLISSVLSQIPQTQKFADVARKIGYGEDGGVLAAGLGKRLENGKVIGGKRMTKAEMKKRLQDASEY